MLGFRDELAKLDQRSSERMHFRTKPEVKAVIQRAAALSGVDDSTFAMNAAYRAALDTIASHERTRLESADHEAFFAALDDPPPPTEKLKAARQRYNEVVDGA